MSGARHVDVLLIEDNPTDVLLTREILGEGPQFSLRHAERLSKGIDMLSDRPFDVILLDLGLPDSHGLDTLLRLRESNAAVPIVVMTGRDDEEVALRAVNLGAQDYLVKSIVDEGALRRSIRYAIERNQTEEALRERAALASMSAEVGIALARGGALAEALGACAESLLRGLDAALSRVWTLDAAGTTLELATSAGVPTALGGRLSSVPVGEGAVGRVASERRPLVTNDVTTSPALDAAERNAVAGLVACAAFPLLVGDRLVGVVGVGSRRSLSPATLDALASAANLIAIGIERERSEENLREVNRTLNSLFDAAPAAIMVLDTRGSLLRWNATAERMFGWSEAEAIGDGGPDGPCDNRREFQRLLAAGLVGETLDGVEVRPPCKDGSLADVALWTAPIRDDAGAVVASLGIFVDVAHRKQLEAQLLQSQKMEAIGLLAGGVAHDFNNLLTVIGGYSDIIRRELPPDNRLVELADEIVAASTRAASLTRQLLVFSRRQVLEPKVLNLNTLVSGIERLLRRLIGEDVTLVSALAPDLGAVKTDAGQIEQVLMNLAVNARDAMPHGGRLTVETREIEIDEAYARTVPHLEPGPYVVLAVSDTGVGMDDETKLRAFEPFYTTKGVGRGTGLGLATVYGIVRQSGGHVQIRSERDVGSTFEVYLPRVVGPAEGEVARAEPVKTARGDETVLLVEDEAALRSLARRVLEMSGYAVLEAVDGEDGLRVASAFPGTIHVLVTDVVMPNMGGSQLAERLLALHPETRVLYLSGYTDDAVVRHGILHADTAFLQKPFTPSALARKVREVLDHE